jgi:phosphohistidine phosphatase
MKLYIMRHGPAEDDSATGRDGDRALTTSGRDRTRSVAKALLDADESPLRIVSSPLVRALQTGEIVAAVTDLDRRAKEAGESASVEIRRELAPGGHSVGLVADLVQKERKRVMLVGHEPDLSSLVAHLVGKAPDQGMLKSMVVGMKVEPTPKGAEGPGFTAKLRFILDPKTLAFQRE